MILEHSSFNALVRLLTISSNDIIIVRTLHLLRQIHNTGVKDLAKIVINKDSNSASV